MRSARTVTTLTLSIVAGLQGVHAAEGAAAVPPTFNGTIAPLLYRNCAVCHHPGGSAPFSLLTYPEAKKHDRQIALVTESRFMPPWLPERGAPRLSGERGLTTEEIALLRRWYDAGAPEGDPAERPTPPRFVEGWALGAPDLELEAPEAYLLPAEGRDVFRTLIIPIPTTSKRYVRAIDMRPGNPRVVHHVVMRLDRSRTARLFDERDPGPGYEGMAWGEARPPAGHFLGWTPGRVPDAGRDELAWVLEPGTDLVVQMHMLPSGKPESIRPRVGLYFTSKPSLLTVETILLNAKKIDIPAGSRDYAVEESYVLPVDVELASVYAHAHFLGKEVDGWAVLPSGERRTLLHIPRWDFSWQDQYDYADKIRLPAGTRLAMRVSYDNSADNEHNPSSPPRRVVSGNSSTDEMGSMSFGAILKREADRRVLQEAMLRQDLARWPNFSQAHGMLGHLLLDRGLPDEALTHLRRAVELDPDYALAFNDLGLALARLERHDEAMASFARALERRPLYADAHYNLGVELASRERLDEAIAHYRRALEIRAFDTDVLNNYGVALALKGQTDEAAAQFRKVLEIDPDSVEANGNLANLLTEEGRYADAIRHFRAALAKSPGSTELQSGLALALELMDEAAGADPK